MNLQGLHDSLISRARNRILSEGFEIHHVIPKSLNGTDEPDNLVKLTYREHFIIHYILAKIHGGEQWCPLLYWKERNSRAYEKAREEVSKLMKSKDPWNKGLTGGSWSIARREAQKYVVHRGLSEKTKAKLRKPKSKEHAMKIKLAKQNQSLETRLKISATQKGKTISESSKLKMSLAKMGKKLSEETKLKMSLAHQRRKLNTSLMIGV